MISNACKGFIYCFSNNRNSYLKIGMTTRKLKVRLNEANNNTWNIGDGLLFKCEFARYTDNCRDSEKRIHENLHGHRVHPKKEFFDNLSLDRVKAEFAKIDGDWYDETHKTPKTKYHHTCKPYNKTKYTRVKTDKTDKTNKTNKTNKTKYNRLDIPRRYHKSKLNWRKETKQETKALVLTQFNFDELSYSRV